MTPAEHAPIAAVMAVLDRGGQPDEAELLRALRSPHCPASLVERLAGSRWVKESRRLLPLVVGHPACPRHFAWDSLARLGWRDLAAVATAPRTPPPVRRQAEKKLVERALAITLGERVALARVAPRPVLLALVAGADAPCVEAILDNPRLTENDAARLLGASADAACAAAVLRHRRWGSSRAVQQAALRSPQVPLALVMGVLVLLPAGALAAVAEARDVPEAVRAAAGRLLARRDGADRPDGGPPPPCTPPVTP